MKNNETHKKSRSAKNARKKHSYLGKNLFTLISTLIVVGIIAGGINLYYTKSQEAIARDHFEKDSDDILNQIKEEQRQNGLPQTEKRISKNNKELIIFTPKEEVSEKIPIENLEEQLYKLTHQTVNELPKRQAALVIGRVAVDHLSDRLDNYKLVAEEYVWDKKKDDFVKESEKSGKSVYINTFAETPITFRDVAQNEANVLAIQQVIQQKLLSEAKNGKKILDDVLNLPKITLDTKADYAPDKLTIYFPENKLQDKITLDYKDIIGYVNTSLVDEKILKKIPQQDPNKKYLALTFDDGPSGENTGKILDILKEKKAKGTFFAIGENVEKQPKTVKRIHKEGHEIATHSYSHELLTEMSPEEIKTDLQKAQKTTYNATGVLPKNLRPPFGSGNRSIAEIANMPFIYWTVDSEDWRNGGSDAIFNQVTQKSEPGAIVIMHDNYPETVAALPRIIDQLQGDGYELVTVDQLLNHSAKPTYQYMSQSNNSPVE